MLLEHSESNGERRGSYLTYYEFILVVTLAVGLDAAIRAAIISRLRNRHSDIWRQLGAPPLLDHVVAGGAGRRVTAYLWKAKWLGSKDPVLIALGLANFVMAFGILALIYIQFILGY